MFETVQQSLENARPKKIIVDISECLKNAQQQQERNLAAEEILAEAANNALHKHDNSDFILCAAVKSVGMFETTGYPRSWIDNRLELTSFGSPYLTSSRKGMVDTYCYGFYRGDVLGYLEKLGKRWVLLLGDATGFFYIPVANVIEVDRISY